MRVVYRIVVVFAMLLVIPSAVQSITSSPSSLDLQKLNLVVKKAETVEEVKCPAGPVVTAIQGFKLVVVTLSGQSDKDCHGPLEVREFSAVFQKNGNTSVCNSSAVSCSNYWGVAPQGGNASVILYCHEGQPVEIKVAFSLPIEVTSFSVRYPALAGGKASLQEECAQATGSSSSPSEEELIAKIRKNPSLAKLSIKEIQPKNDGHKARAAILGDAVVGDNFYFFLSGSDGSQDFPVGDGSIHELGESFEFPVGSLRFKFKSDKDDPLVFALLDDIGYTYLHGKGTVIFPDGKQVKLGF